MFLQAIEVICMPGVGISVVAFAVGAILDFAVTASPYQHGFNINRVGAILMIVGAVGFVVSLLVFGGGRGWYGTRRHETVVDDGRGNYVHREDTYQ
jgi:hypothetical protein